MMERKARQGGYKRLIGITCNVQPKHFFFPYRHPRRQYRGRKGRTSKRGVIEVKERESSQDGRSDRYNILPEHFNSYMCYNYLARDARRENIASGKKVLWIVVLEYSKKQGKDRKRKKRRGEVNYLNRNRNLHNCVYEYCELEVTKKKKNIQKKKKTKVYINNKIPLNAQNNEEDKKVMKNGG